MSQARSRDKFIATASPILQRLEHAGYEAYLVGGCVREALREEMREAMAAGPDAPAGPARPVTDIDITTNARPEEVCRVFADLPVIETGLQHGTVTVLLPNRIPIEITTYRVDGGYSDGRHPDQVCFVTSLTEDLRRRDFTVNAMAMDRQGQVTDPFGGQADLAAGIIRAVGDPETRFREDGLRILRALRFAAALTTDAPAGTRCTGFRIAPATEAALFRCAHLLENISAERIFAELKKLLCGPASGEVIRRYADILAVVIPELGVMKGFAQHNPYHKYDVLEHCIRAMEAVQPVDAEKAAVEMRAAKKVSVRPQAARPAPETADLGGSVPADLATIKLTALLHDVGKPVTYSQDEKGIGHFYGHPQAGARIARRILHRLKADRAATDRITHLIHYHDLVFQEDDRLLKRWMNRHTPQVLLEILAIKRADNIATGNATPQLLEKFDRIKTQIRRILQESREGQTCFRIRDLAISGRDLLALGIPQGPEIGQLLEKLLEAVIDGILPNQREALLQAAESLRNPCG